MSACTCRWCSIPEAAVPAGAAIAIVVVLAVIGGGRYVWWVDAAVLFAVAACVGTTTLGAVQRLRAHHADR